MSHIVFRQYQESDNKQIKYLHRVALEAIGAYSPGAYVDDDLDNIQKVYLQGGDFLVGLVNKRIVAMGALRRVSEDVAEVKRMRVLPEFQGQGVGTALLHMMEQRAKHLGFNTIILDTTVNLLAAQKLYTKSGYTEIKREKEGHPYETIFYQKELE